MAPHLSVSAPWSSLWPPEGSRLPGVEGVDHLQELAEHEGVVLGEAAAQGQGQCFSLAAQGAAGQFGEHGGAALAADQGVHH